MGRSEGSHHRHHHHHHHSNNSNKSNGSRGHNKTHKSHNRSKSRKSHRNHSNRQRTNQFQTLKGKAPKNQNTITGPSQMTPEQLTTIYHVPDNQFKNEEEVASFNGFKVEKEIARGGFAIIYKAKQFNPDRPAACKVVELGNDPNSAHMAEMKNELFIMERVNNPFAIKLYLHYVVNTSLYIFMQFAEDGSFGKLLEKNGVLDEKDSKHYFSQMICGVEHMHELCISHRDIKPANFLMSKHKGEMVVLISDFGLSRVVHKDVKNSREFVLYTTQCGTPAYMAPEILSGDSYDAFLVDVWSLGVTLYAMLNLATPFDVNQEDYGAKDMMNHKWEWTDGMKSPPSDDLKSIMSGMLEPKPSKRLNIKKLGHHDWIRSEYERVKKF